MQESSKKFKKAQKNYLKVMKTIKPYLNTKGENKPPKEKTWSNISGYQITIN